MLSIQISCSFYYLVIEYSILPFILEYCSIQRISNNFSLKQKLTSHLGLSLNLVKNQM